MDMKTQIKAALLVVLALAQLSSLAFAGGHIGNGGDAVTQPGKVTLLDLAEQDYKVFDPLEFGDGMLPFRLRDAYGLFLSKVGRVPVFTRELVWAFTDRRLEDVRDEGAIRLSLAGKVEQVAIQKDGFVIINEPLFRRMDRNSQSALFLHESMIATALRDRVNLNSPEGTGPLREIVALLMSAHAELPPEKVYKQIWNRMPGAQDLTYKNVRGFFTKGNATAYFVMDAPKIEDPNTGKAYSVHVPSQSSMSKFELSRYACNTISQRASGVENFQLAGPLATPKEMLTFEAGEPEVKSFGTDAEELIYLRCQLPLI